MEKPPSRRSTLGPVNGRRSSVGGPVKTPGKPTRRPPNGRMSMLPRVGRESLIPPSPAAGSTASSRRRSVSGDRRQSGIGGGDRRQSLAPPLGHSVKSDPRPITDKAYQNQCIKQLLQYLTKTGYTHPVSSKSLARPSGKDFSNIVSFMLCKLDPCFQDGSMKFEDEVAMNFKAMGYPFPISKTALVAAGSPHTWPALLSALTWLMEHLQCEEADETFVNREREDSDKPFETMEELERKTDDTFFKFLSENYSAFLNGNQQLTEELEERFVDTFERDNMVIEQEIERVTDLNGVIVERINNLSQQSQSLPALEKKRDDYATDLEQFEDLVRQMDEHKEAIEQKVKERTAELTAVNSEVETMTSKVVAMKEMIQGQELSIDDIRKMESEQLRVKESLERASALRQQCREELWETDAELTKLVEALDAVINDYNTQLSELALILDDASRTDNFKMSLKKQHLASGDQSLFLGVDLFAEVRPFLSRQNSETADSMARVRRELQEALDRLDASEGAFTEALDKLKIVEDKKTRCEEILNRERDQQEAALAVRLREVTAVERKVESLRDPAAIEEQITSFQRQCTQLEALRMKHEEDNLAQKRAIENDINVALKLIAEHKIYIQKKLAEVQQYALRKSASLGKVSSAVELEFGNVKREID